jgi:fluoride ion exporter CrcB/FEX
VWLPTLIGAAIGGVFAAFHRYCSARMWRPPNSPLNILVTGKQRLTQELTQHIS